METIDYEKTGAFIAEKRREKGLTQKQLADMLHITDRAVSKWERAKSFPDPSLLMPLCQALGISIGDLFEGEETEKMPLSQEKAGDIALRGISMYAVKFGKKNTQYKIAAVVLTVLCICISAVVFWQWQQNQPIDLERGDYAVGAISIGEAGETRTFTPAKAFATEYEMQIKNVLASIKEKKPCKKLNIQYREKFVTIDGIGKFYASGYEDEKSGRLFTYQNDSYQKIFDLCAHIMEETDYRYAGEKTYAYGKGVLNIKCQITEKAQETVLEDYRRYLKEEFPVKDFPNAYIKQLDILAIERLLRSDYKALSEFPLIKKELAYYETWDYRIYRVKTDRKYTEALKALGPQHPDGPREEIMMVIDKGGGYELHHF